MSYQIFRTEKADMQLRDLIYYIAEDFGSTEIAIRYLDKLEHAIGLLKDQPYYGPEARLPSLKRQHFRVLIVERHLIFYKVRERDRTVMIYAVVDSRQNYEDLIL